MLNHLKKGQIFALLSTVVAFLFSCYFMTLSRTPYTPKIYDCFLFYNELELLEIRLNEIYDHVDKIVLVEACETFRGQPKPFFFAENWHLFEKFADKIIHVPITEHLETDDPWTRERFQREQIFRGLAGCRNEDIVFLSDVDEIVRGSRIKEIASLISSHQLQAAVCIQKMYYGYLNRFQREWPGTVCSSFKEAKKLSTKFMRRLRNMRPRTLKKTKISKIAAIEDAGWHFTSMGGLDRYIRKIESFSHTEFDRPEFKQKEYMMNIIYSLPFEEIDDTFPKYVKENRSYFEKIGFIEESSTLLPSGLKSAQR